MLDRIRGMVQRLELPQEEQEDVIYRILDDDGKVVEVSPAQYGRWRVQHDVARLAVVEEDTVGNILVKTTFSIMPENRSYKPFGTSAFALPDFDPLVEYSTRYDTRKEAEEGHRGIQDRIRKDLARALRVDEKLEDLSRTAGQVRLAISADLPALFEVSHQSEDDESLSDEVTVKTPLLSADGTPIVLTVSRSGSGFVLTGDVGASDGPRGTERLEPVCRLLGLTVESERLVASAEDVSQLGEAMIKLAQGLACASILNLRQE